MFLAALGEPTDSFDGSVGIWPVLEEFQPLRASVSHPRVNGQLVPYMKSATMDGDLFVKMKSSSLIFRELMNLVWLLLPPNRPARSSWSGRN